MRFKRFIAMAAALAISATALTGCIRDGASLIKDKDGNTVVTLGYANFVVRIVQTYTEYTTAQQYQMYGMSVPENMWAPDEEGNTEAMDSTKDNAINAIEEMYVMKKHAADYGVELSDDDREKITEAAKKFIDENDPETIEKMTATQENVERYLEENTYESRVRAILSEEADVDISDEEAATHIITYAKFSTTGTYDSTTGAVTPFTDEELEEIKEQAESLAEVSADSFNDEVEELSYGELTEEVSYTKDSESFNEDVIKAADELDDDEISDVVEVEDDGYYVIKMVSKNDEEATESTRESLEEEAKSNYVTEMIEKWVEEEEFTVSNYQWNKVIFDATFELRASESEETEEEDIITSEDAEDADTTSEDEDEDAEDSDTTSEDEDEDADSEDEDEDSES